MKIVINQIINNYLFKQGIDLPEVQWLLKFQLFCLVFGLLLILVLGSFYQVIAFLIGALLASLNLFVLARLLPQLIWVRKGAVFTLLLSFYLRLFFTAIVLFLALVSLKLSPVVLLLGLSTVIVTIVLGIGKYIVTLKSEKEA